MDELGILRREIDEIDGELARLFARRMEVTHRVGLYKAARGLPVLDAAREAEVLQNKAALASGRASAADLVALFEAIMAISRAQQREILADVKLEGSPHGEAGRGEAGRGEAGRGECRVNSQRSGEFPQGGFIPPEDVKSEGSPHGEAGRVNSQRSGEFPQGGFIPPEDVKSEGSPHGEAGRGRTPVSNPLVLYQGEPGAYAEEAAARFFGETCRRDRKATWEDIFLALRDGEADYGVLPIENNSTGGINQVYDLLAQYGAFIVGEQIVHVNHCLMAPKGAAIAGISAVFSHEQGLIQCRDFLKNHPHWRQIPRLNTAESAKFVATCGDPGQAAIGSRRAAALYGLDILAENINFNSGNDTRFVVVSPTLELRDGADKISALVTLPHRSGTLFEMMKIFALHGRNLLKLESRPILGRSWEYAFFVDFSGNLREAGMDTVLRELEGAASSFRVLGNYRGAAE